MERLRNQFEDQKTVGIVCIYCNYKEKDTQTLVNLVASIWMQLANYRETLSDNVKALYMYHIHRCTRPELRDALNALKSEIERFSKVFIVVDALDEHPENGICLANALIELQMLQPTVSLMVTSRFVDTIAHKFKGMPCLEISANVGDVRTYVTERISRESHLSHLVSEDATLQENIIETIVRNARKM